MQIPAEVKKQVEAKLTNRNAVNITNFQPALGGCISNGGKLTTTSGDYFIKWNNSRKFPDMFQVEAKGLQLLASKDSIKIPDVIHFSEGETYSWILLEYLHNPKRQPDFWIKLGEGLALLHKNTAEFYGLGYNNYIGSLPQNNGSLSNWVEFLITNRFEPMVKMAVESGKADESLAADFQRLYPKLNSLLTYEPPSLLHGDLWSGNLISDKKGNPAFIDPAIYYGNREIELAFTGLFGGFDEKFYSAYNHTWPLQEDHQHRFDIYNLYPLMVHVNLFGGNYLNQVKTIIHRFI